MLRRSIAAIIFAIVGGLMNSPVVHAQTGSNQLQITAAAMSPGTWAQVPQDATSIWLALECGGACGGMGVGNIVGDANTAAWDWRHLTLRFAASEHDGTVHAVTYTAADNTWHEICGEPVSIFDPTNPGWNACGLSVGDNTLHGYRANTTNPITGIHYFVQNRANVPYEIHQLAPGDTSFSLAFTSSPTDYYQSFDPTFWWEGPLTGGDASGNLVGYLSSLVPDGFINIWHPTTNTLESITVPGAGGSGNYNSWAVYSRRLNLGFFGGGNAFPNRVYMMDYNKTITQLDDAPQDVGDRQYNIFTDPVSGYPIIFGGSGGTRHIYILNPLAMTGSQWTELTGTNVPPSAVLDPADPTNGVIAIPIENYGGTMVISCLNGSTSGLCNMYFYKYAATDLSARVSVAEGSKRSFGFDTTADIPQGYYLGGGVYRNFAMIDSDLSGFAYQGIDTSVKAEGAGSYHCTIPASPNAASGCSWASNFQADYSGRCPIDGDCDVHIQWLQLMGTTYLTNLWENGGGWKLVGMSAGDADDSTFTGSCDAVDFVTFQGHIGGPYSVPGTLSAEYGCQDGSTNNPGFNSIEVSAGEAGYPLGAPGGTIALQNARYDPYCLYSQLVATPPTLFPPTGNCFPFSDSEWITWQISEHIGPRGLSPWLRINGAGTLFSWGGSGTISGTSVTDGSFSAPFALSKSDCSSPSYLSCQIVYHASGSSTLALTTSYSTATSGGNTPVSFLITDGSGNIVSKTQPLAYQPNDEWHDSWVDLRGARENQPSEWLVHYVWPYGRPAGLPSEGLRIGKVEVLSYDTNRCNPSCSMSYPVADNWYDSVAFESCSPSGTCGPFPDPLELDAVAPTCTPDHLAFTAQPSNALLGASLGTVSVAVEDSGNNVCGSDTSTVTLSMHAGACTGMTLNGTVSGAASSGVFTTSNLDMTVATGSCSLDADDGMLTGATSNSFTISSPPAGVGRGKKR